MLLRPRDEADYTRDLSASLLKEGWVGQWSSCGQEHDDGQELDNRG